MSHRVHDLFALSHNGEKLDNPVDNPVLAVTLTFGL